jgi:hypothetical protein
MNDSWFSYVNEDTFLAGKNCKGTGLPPLQIPEGEYKHLNQNSKTPFGGSPCVQFHAYFKYPPAK